MGDAQRPREPVSSDPLLLTPEEAATLLRVGRTTVYALMKAGELRPVHIGRSCRLARAELERHVRRLQNPPQATSAHRRPTQPKTANQSGLFDPDPRDAAWPVHNRHRRQTGAEHCPPNHQEEGR